MAAGLPKVQVFSVGGLILTSLLLTTQSCDLGLFGSDPTGAPISERTFASDFDNVWSVVHAVLAERHEPISSADRSQGRIQTASVNVNQQRLQQISQVPSGTLTRHGGRYVLTITLASIATNETKVSMETLIVATNPESMNPLGGQPLASNGTLDKEVFDSISQRLKEP